MSDALLTEISKKLGDIHATLKAGAATGASSGGATRAATPGTGNKAAPAKPADKPAAVPAKPAAAKPAAAAAKGGPAPGTKGPGGKYTVEQVRDIIRKVAADESLGRQSAKDILAEDGGVEKIMDLKPENYDKVYEACQVLMSGEGTKGAAPAADDDFD